MRITRLGRHLGARVDGVDLATLDDAGFRALEDAFHAHGDPAPYRAMNPAAEAVTP